MLARLRRLRRYVKTNGARRTALALGRLLRGLVYMEVQMIVLIKRLDSIAEPRSDGGLRVEDLVPERLGDLAELNRRRGRPEVQRLLEGYVEQGFHGFLAYRGEELVGYYWWVDREVPAQYTDTHKLGLGIELAEGDVYGSHFFLLEEHRGGGAATDFLFKVERSLRDRGYVRLWGYVAGGNRPARWVYSTRGYTPMWSVRLRRLAHIQRTTRESL
ncbi:MAG TPA: GNAT family N-acetyltransferase [Kofleriaceae bacterium]|nr:GNAT family N-acetyltransferase [Kofleriaceae bacterium]